MEKKQKHKERSKVKPVVNLTPSLNVAVEVKRRICHLPLIALRTHIGRHFGCHGNVIYYRAHVSDGTNERTNEGVNDHAHVGRRRMRYMRHTHTLRTARCMQCTLYTLS